MDHGTQIKLFLTDGSATGFRYAELVNWTGWVFACPRILFTKLKEWPQMQRVGVYVLIGLNRKGENAVYIGESENVLTRLLSHLSQSKSTLDDVVEAFFFTSKDDNLDKGHITFLEQRLTKRAQETKQYAVEYGREPSAKALAKMESAAMEEFLENLYLVAAVLGRPPQIHTGLHLQEFECRSVCRSRGRTSRTNIVASGRKDPARR